MDEQKLKDLKQKRENIEIMQLDFKQRQEEFNEQNKPILEEINKSLESMDLLKSEIKIEALNEFETTGNKQLLGGIGIREGIDFIYEDNIALDWAIQHNLCLSLNKTAFKKLAKTQEMDFVTKEPKITVTFPAKIVL